VIDSVANDFEHKVYFCGWYISQCRIPADLLRLSALKASQRLTSSHASFVTMTFTSDVTLPADTLPKRWMLASWRKNAFSFSPRYHWSLNIY